MPSSFAARPKLTFISVLVNSQKKKWRRLLLSCSTPNNTKFQVGFGSWIDKRTFEMERIPRLPIYDILNLYKLNSGSLNQSGKQISWTSSAWRRFVSIAAFAITEVSVFAVNTPKPPDEKGAPWGCPRRKEEVKEYTKIDITIQHWSFVFVIMFTCNNVEIKNLLIDRSAFINEFISKIIRIL